jgi:hypothetical protein
MPLPAHGLVSVLAFPVRFTPAARHDGDITSESIDWLIREAIVAGYVDCPCDVASADQNIQASDGV